MTMLPTANCLWNFSRQATHESLSRLSYSGILVYLQRLTSSIQKFCSYTIMCMFVRDGVSESQFNQVLNIEVDQIIKVMFQSSLSGSGFYQIMFSNMCLVKVLYWTVCLLNMMQAYQRLGETDVPKFTVIVAQKRHHTKLFQAKGHENVPAGKADTFFFLSSASVTTISNLVSELFLHRKRHLCLSGTVVDTKIVHPTN